MAVLRPSPDEISVNKIHFPSFDIPYTSEASNHPRSRSALAPGARHRIPTRESTTESKSRPSSAISYSIPQPGTCATRRSRPERSTAYRPGAPPVRPPENQISRPPGDQLKPAIVRQPFDKTRLGCLGPTTAIE